jgi:hypothetical protein
MALFTLKKKSSSVPPPPQQQAPSDNNPAQIILSLRQQGLDNNQIIQYLQRGGLSSGQIFDALTMADNMVPADQAPMEAFPPGEMQPQMPQQRPMAPPPMQPQPPQYQQQDSGSDKEKIEELAEAIIDEKWEEFSKNINKIIEWKNKTEAKMLSMEQEFKDLKDNFEKLHAAIIGKIGEYDQSIRNVDTDIKAMETVFKKIMPTFTDNVNELSRIVKNTKP